MKRPPHITRTAESIETPDLTRLPQWHGQLNAEELASEFRNCVVFAVACIFGLLAFQFLWS